MAGLAVITGGTWAACVPRTVPASIARVGRGPLRVTVDGAGRARVRDRFVLTAPIAGHLERIALRAGDRVVVGTIVARITAVVPAALDARARAELGARADAANGALNEAMAGVQRAREAEAHALSESARSLALADAGAVTAQQLADAQFETATRRREREMAEAAYQRARGEARASAAAFAPSTGRDTDHAVLVRAPVTGFVLRALQETDGPIAPGTPLLEIGDPHQLEGVVELVTPQAVGVRPGAQVEISQWGGGERLSGRVRRVEPSAFTKVSPLGVSEQRVNVIIEPEKDGAWSGLMDGYQFEAGIVVRNEADALKLPATAVFRGKDRWKVFIVDRGRARAREIELGDSSGLEVEVRAGVFEGEAVVLSPDDRFDEGALVAVR